MPVDILMPNLGFDTPSAKVIEWLKQPGDSVTRGEAIAVIESDKANVELEAIAGGTVLEVLYAAGDEVAIGAVIARVGDAKEQAAVQSQSARKSVSPVAQRMIDEHRVDAGQVQGSGPGGRITRRDIERHLETSEAPQSNGNGVMPLALPKVRKAAREAGIRLEDVLAFGAENPITLAALERYQQRNAAPVKTQPAAEPVTVTDGAKAVELSKMRQTIGKRLSDSMRTAPHFYVTGEFDLEDALHRLNSLPAPQPGLNDLVQYLTVQALLNTPQLNATYAEDVYYQHQAIDLAIAVAREDGLITPVIPGAQQYSLQGLAAASKAVIRRARDNHLHSGDMRPGTFTISNLGIIAQVEQFTAVINPPQVAILAVGAIKPRPVVRDGGLHIRHTVHLTLSGDHRVVDGMHLGRFMAAFQTELDRFAR